MSGTDLTLAGADLVARGSGALWWPAERLLCVSDLHLGRSERLARRGGTLLPPYESRETLARFAVEITVLDPATVVCLGDSFDDLDCEAALEAEARDTLMALMAGRDWIWIAGNHDPGPLVLGGRHLAQLARDPLTFRHEARPAAVPGEVSGHYHPKMRVPLPGRGLSRPCFLRDARRLILPAFGTYTGGLRADDPALRALFAPDAVAILTGSPQLVVPAGPLPRRTGPA